MADDLTATLFASMVLVINQRTVMNEEQKQWIEKLKAIIAAQREDSVAAYEALVEEVQDHVDASPEP